MRQKRKEATNITNDETEIKKKSQMNTHNANKM